MSAVAAPPPETVPLTRVHAHNDYLHTRPLLDALDQGFCSVEADVHLVGGQLLVAHDRSKVKAGRTLQVLYLDPLQERVRQNGGAVYPAGPQFTLLIDLKDDWHSSYPVLRDLLIEYSKILSRYEGDICRTNAVQVIITGNRSTNMLAGETVRYAAVDGDLVDLDSGLPPSLIPWISSNWFRSFSWRGEGALPATEKRKLENIVAKAHHQGKRVRFWGAPDQPVFWQALLDARVDLINTDDLPGARQFLLEHGTK